MNAKHAFVEYYGDIIPDKQGLLRTLQTSLPTCLWVNTLKIAPAAFYKLMACEGFSLTPLPWHPSAFRASSLEGLGKSWPYYAGLFQIQEEVSMLSGILLNPKPGEKVLDLCAAPGNKTAQLSVAMKNQGTLVANDRNYGRMKALGQIVKRLGLMNISTTIYDGAIYPRVENYFDKVLVDAPCSCEGTFRKSENKVVNPNADRSKRMGAVQFALLKKAIQVCKPGGKILYSTCTFAPEENERVINHVLNTMGDKVRVVPIAVENFKHSPGITEWQGENFDKAVVDTMRIWPHLNNTGGFYVALLEKIENSQRSDNGKELVEKSYQEPDEELQKHLHSLCDRFGIDKEIFSQFNYITDSKRGVYLTNQDNHPPLKLAMDATGLFFLKTKILFPKMVTGASMVLAPYATKNLLHLSKEQVEAFFRRAEFILDKDQQALCVDTGYALVFYKDTPIGMGLYLTPYEEKPGRLRSLYPKYLIG